MTTPPQPAPGNPYAQPVPGNPYTDQVPAQGSPYPPQYPPQPQFQAPPQQPAYPQPPQQYQQPQQFPPPQPQYQQQPPQYQQPQQPQQFQQQPLPQYSPNGSDGACRFCGAQPAADATVRAHRGMVLVMQWRRQSGPFCRTCGIATVRKLSADTLIQGWWGAQSFFRTPFTLIQNALAYRKFKALPQPVPGPGQPLPLGRPLLLRAGAIGLVVPLAVLALVLYGITASSSDPSYASVGDCVQNQGTDSNPNVHVTACAPGTYKVIDKLSDTTSDSGCPQSTSVSYTQQEGSDEFVLCLVNYS